MPRSYIRVFVHVVFSTHNREPLISPDLQPRLHAYLGGILRHLGATPVTIGGVSDHVHLLMALPATVAVAELVDKVKANSSKWLNETFSTSFAWQRGYAAFSVSPSAVERVRHYVDGQAEHHRVVTFRDELIRFLREAGVEYDERYLFT